ncbi:MAG: methionyl-tRNA formyltransferase [Candidatus Kaiserbacteria bacterium]|nr:methionyl-tRNA formyltransferase [Candidatus Kaiserbacteria bacterium]
MNSSSSFAFFGTPFVASETLAVLIAHDFIPAIVVTSPDAPKGRGLAVMPSEVKTLALAHGISVFTPETFDTEIITTIRAKKCDYAVVVAYGKIFPEELIELFPKGVLNIHYSLLPKYRGATPLESALLAGDLTTGVTVQKMAREVDAGDIVAQKETPIAQAETARELRPRLIEMGAQLLVDTLNKYLSGDVEPVPQDNSLASHTKKIKKEDGLLSLDASDEENWRKYRAYADGIGTYFFENNKRIKITKASLKNGEFVIERVIPEGKHEMDYKVSQ